MVVPWVGFPLSHLLRRFEPKARGDLSNLRRYTVAVKCEAPGHLPV
jgi:DMSO/TMAO reductase YedYZ molybdopterin-dependent catalytic subunit